MEQRKQSRIAGALALALAIVAAGCAGSGAPPERGPAPDRVMIGYGSMDQAQMTGAVGSVTERSIRESKMTNLLDIIQGRLAGVQVVRGPAGVSLQVRGFHSLRGSSEPLLVVDGVAVRWSAAATMMQMSPGQVARIDVLKDAGSTAIYGSRGAHGVILVTTKRGR